MSQLSRFQTGPRRRSAARSLLVAAVVALALLGAGRLQDLLPSFGNPFSESAVDHSAPVVLAALEDVSRFEAATANYSVIVDLEKDTRFVPAFIKGERTVFMAVGSVDASVDFAGLDSSSVTAEKGRVTLRLPAAEITPARVDPAESRVVSRDRGVVDRIGSVFADSPTSERDLYLAAERKLERAAAADDVLVRRAERNTEAMLASLLEPLGFDEVSVVFEEA